MSHQTAHCQALISTATQNTVQNENKWYGDEITTFKEVPHTRIMFHNINGMSLKGVKGIDVIANEQESLQVDLQGMSEHCLDTCKFHVTHTASEILRRQFNGKATLHLTSSSEQAVNTYKPGGTALLMLGPITGRLEPQGRGGDDLGRWSYVHLRRKHQPPLTIISAYQVCQRPTNQIGNTAYHQQQRILSKQGRHDIHPRKAFIQDLIAFITNLQNKGHGVILGGDFNESLTDKHSGILQLAMTTNLIDPFLTKFPNHDEQFGTHMKGHRRIDIALISPNLFPYLQKIGYGPFDFTTASDHRPLIIDFTTTDLFGEPGDLLQNAHLRSLRSNDKKSVYTFVTTMYAELLQQKAFEYQELLDRDEATPELVELVDNLIGQSSNIAEKKCKRRRPAFFSNALVQQRVKVSILKAHLNALRWGRNCSSQLHKRMQRLGIELQLPLTRRLTKEAMTAAQHELHNIIQDSLTNRQAEIDMKILSSKASGNRNKTKILRAMKKVETGRYTYRMLRAIRQPSTSHTLDRIEIPTSWPLPTAHPPDLESLEDPKTCTNWRLITCPEEIEYYLMMRNRLHFGQAEGTPFTIPPLQHAFDWEASTVASESLLQGTSAAYDTLQQCQELLAACKAVSTLDSVPAEITKPEFRGKITSWKEATTTSPSGRHLGRYKALFAPGPLEDVPVNGAQSNAVSFDKQQEMIAALILSVLNYCIRHTHVLSRWKTIVNVMIFKEPGNFKIHRLRVIHIYEADFNMLLAIKWRKLLHHADNLNSINPGQYGGRPGCEAQSLTLLEELTRRTLVNFDNDATSCYDRILLSLASLINRKYGMHRKVVAIHARTLQQAVFRLKTAAGLSQIHYTHSTQFPIHGTGQGSGNSPCIWLFISSTLFDVHARSSKGLTYVSPDGTETVHMSMIGFVDDSTGSCNDFQPMTQEPLQSILKMMEQDAQTWNDLLHCSGGKLELPKCSFHVLHFDFTPEGKPVPTIDKFDGTIQIRDSQTDSHIPIPSKRAYEFHKTLGHYKSPVTNLQQGIKMITTKANRLATVLALSPISRYGAYLAYHTIFIPTVRYTLPQSFYPTKLLEQSQAQSLCKLLPKCGYNRNTARAIIFAPLTLAGGGFLPWHILQGEGQIMHIIKHWRTNTIISTTLRIAIKWAQWQSGHEKSIFDDTVTPLPYLESRWLCSARSFMAAIGARLIFDHPLISQKETTQDEYIMKYARETRVFSDNDLKIINYCRLYLHITTISEMFDETGTKILPFIQQCQQEPWFNPNTYVVLQPRPSEYHIRTKWKKFCRQLSTEDGTIAASIRLGKWKIPGESLRRRRQTYIVAASRKMIYHWREGHYWLYQSTAANPTIFLPVRQTTWQPTESCTPVTVELLQQDAIRLTRQRKTIYPAVSRRIPVSFEQYILTLNQWEQDLLQGVHFILSPYEIHHHFQQHQCQEYNLLMVSDGSQQGPALSYGWVFGDENGNIFAEHSGSGYGTPTSHRAEGWGMLSGTLFLKHLYCYLNIPNTSQQLLPQSLNFYSDNSGLINRISQRIKYRNSYPNATLNPDWDIIQQIYELLYHTIPYTTNGADELAGIVERPPTHPYHPLWLLPAEKVRLQINHIPVYGNYSNAIRRAYTVPPMLAYLRERHHWTVQIQDTVDWKVLEQATKYSMIPAPQLLKLVHNKMPTRHEQAKSNAFLSHRCPACGENETFTHLLRCPNQDISQQFREDLLEILDEYFDQTNTPAPFRQLVATSFQYWLDAVQINPPEIPDIRCLQQQQLIGWDLFPRGFIAKAWLEEHELSVTNEITTAPLVPSEHFMVGLLRTIWKAQLDFWKQYSSSQHRPDISNAHLISDKVKEYQTCIRILHQQKDQCLHSHRESYFHDNVDEYIHNATATQMRAYLHHYEPAVRNSIAAAKKLQTRSIFQFRGFTRRQRQHPGPLPIPLPPPHQTIIQTSISTRGESRIRKHTRWRQATTQTLQGIRDFFSKPSPT